MRASRPEHRSCLVLYWRGRVLPLLRTIAPPWQDRDLHTRPDDQTVKDACGHQAAFLALACCERVEQVFATVIRAIQGKASIYQVFQRLTVL